MKKVSIKSLMSISLATILLFLSSCYDDSEFRKRLDDYELRLAALEQLCEEMNTNIASMQLILTALQNNDYATGIIPITENGKEIGYTITFSKSGSVTIYHGKDGKDGQNGKDGADGKDGKDGQDGSTPVIGVRQDTDGLWYWTLNGEWLLDGKGAKVRATPMDGKNGQDGKDGKDGANGQDGVTPQLKIEEGDWYISYDSGKSWQKVGQASGKDGKDGTSFFKSVDVNPTQVVLVLADGQTVILPRELELSVTFEPARDTLLVTSHNMQFDVLCKVTASLASADNLSMELVSTDDVQARIQSLTRAKQENSCTMEGTIHIETDYSVSAYTKVTVFVSDDRKVLVRSIYFADRTD